MIAQAKLSGYTGRLPNPDYEAAENEAPYILAQKALMAKYGIQSSKGDAEK